jgi:hypothetical protein
MKCIKCGSEEFTLHKDGIDQGGYCDAHYWQGRAHRAEAELESKGAKIMSKDPQVKVVGEPILGTMYVTAPLPMDNMANYMTLRQYAAIKLKVPNSGIPELDAMIVQSRRDELAETVVAGVLASLQEGDDFPVAGCDWAYKVANALLKAGEAK